MHRVPKNRVFTAVNINQLRGITYLIFQNFILISVDMAKKRVN